MHKDSLCLCCVSESVALPLPVLQEWGRGVPHSLFSHAHFWGHSSVLHGTGSWPVSEGGTYLGLENLSSPKGKQSIFTSYPTKFILFIVVHMKPRVALGIEKTILVQK